MLEETDECDKSRYRYKQRLPSPIQTPVLSNSRWRDLQTKQNAALKTVTGCHTMTSEVHLHHEAEVLRVKEHNELLSLQFLLEAHLEEHPDHQMKESPDAKARNIRPTLKAKYGQKLKAHVPLEDLDQEGYRWDLSTIHKDLAKQVTAYMLSLWPADALSRPEVNRKEKQLPRKTRCTLVQLRSGYSIFLNSYRSGVDPDVKDQCPECSGSLMMLHTCSTVQRDQRTWE